MTSLNTTINDQRRPPNLNFNTNNNHIKDHLSPPHSRPSGQHSPNRGRSRSQSPRRVARSNNHLTTWEADALIKNFQNNKNSSESSHTERFELNERENVDVSIDHDHHIPEISTRLDDDSDTEGRFSPGSIGVKSRRPHSVFPNNNYYPRFPDSEFGGINPDLESIPDINVYQHKKTLAQGMMDLALFSANANQLRYVLESSGHAYYYPGLTMITISLILQVLVGVGLIWNSRYNVKDERQICIANKINNFTIIGIFLVTALNVFISAFGTTSLGAAGQAQAPFPISFRKCDGDENVTTTEIS